MENEIFQKLSYSSENEKSYWNKKEFLILRVSEDVKNLNSSQEMSLFYSTDFRVTAADSLR